MLPTLKRVGLKQGRFIPGYANAASSLGIIISSDWALYPELKF